MVESEAKSATRKMLSKKWRMRNSLKPTIWMKMYPKTGVEAVEDVLTKGALQLILRSWGVIELWRIFSCCGLASRGACNRGS